MTNSAQLFFSVLICGVVCFVASQTCQVVTVEGRTFNLSSFHSDYVWGSSFGGDKYFLSACEDVVRPSLNCSDQACVGFRIDSRGNCHCLGRARTARWYLGGDNLMVSYSGGTPGNESFTDTMTLTLSCSSTQQKPTSVTEFYNNYAFVWKTPLVCGSPPSPSPSPSPSSGYLCRQLSVGGFQYNLTPLANDTLNGSLIRGLLYYVSPCKTIPEPTADCYRTSDSSCVGYQVGAGPGGSCLCLGKAHTAVVTATNATSLSILYTDGTRVSSSIFASLRVNLTCGAVEILPSSVTVSPSFEFSFAWRTPAACMPSPTPTPSPSCQCNATEFSALQYRVDRLERVLAMSGFRFDDYEEL
eukprot:c7217_g1_i1.p1 GENE.c7217_g1_i1~~c7217_g1_i1.p1  ORF type:complete len:357 (+),score=55.76 c7217_g1_i1:92-1162(+)